MRKYTRVRQYHFTILASLWQRFFHEKVVTGNGEEWNPKLLYMVFPIRVIIWYRNSPRLFPTQWSHERNDYVLFNAAFFRLSKSQSFFHPSILFFRGWSVMTMFLPRAGVLQFSLTRGLLLCFMCSTSSRNFGIVTKASIRRFCTNYTYDWRFGVSRSFCQVKITVL